MPVTYPVVPAAENTVRARIIKKYTEYITVFNRLGNTNQTQGERYEIAVAIFLMGLNKLTNPNQLSRWHTGNVPQNISLGANTEYDFIIPGIAQFPNFAGAGIPNIGGVLLGEAKSYHGGKLNQYIQKAVGYCLHDPANLAGLCFITTGAQGAVWQQVITQALSILSDPQLTPGICGGPSWQNRAAIAGKPTGANVVAHFQQYNTQALRQNRAQTATSQGITRELIQHAGFFVVVYNLANLNHDQLRDLVGRLP